MTSASTLTTTLNIRKMESDMLYPIGHKFNTGNPLGSPDPRDLYDNAGNLDLAINSEEETWRDRFGRDRLSWGGLELQFQTAFQTAQDEREAVFDHFMENAGYVDIGDYDADGPLTITA